MADKTVRIRLEAVVASYQAAMARAGASTKALGETVAKQSLKNKANLQTLGLGATIMGGAMLAGFASSVNAAREFDAAMSVVQANVDDKSVPSMERLRQAAIDSSLAHDTAAFSATAAAQAENELAKAGLSAAQITGGALKAALTLASAGQIDVAQSAEIMSATLTQFKLGASDAAHVADLLAAGADKSLGGVGDLGEALKYAGVNASQFGLSTDETVGTLAMFASNGIKGSMAGTSFRQMLVSLASPTKQASEAMKQYGITVFDQQGNFIGMSGLAQQLQDKLGGLTQQQQQAALSTIFTTRSMSTANILMKDGAAGVDRWTRSVNDQGFASQQAATKLDNLNGDLTRLSNAFDAAQIAGGEHFQGALRIVVQGATGALKVFNALPGPVQAFATGMLGLVGAVTLFGGATLLLAPRIAATRVAMQELTAANTLGIGSFRGFVTAANLAKASAIGFGILGLVTLVNLLDDTAEKANAAADALEKGVGSGVGAAQRTMADFRASVEDAFSPSLRERIASIFHPGTPVIDPATQHNLDAFQNKIDDLNVSARAMGGTERVATLARANYMQATLDAAVATHDYGEDSDKARAAIQKQKDAEHDVIAAVQGAGKASGDAAGSINQLADAHDRATLSARKQRLAELGLAGGLGGLLSDMLSLADSHRSLAAAQAKVNHLEAVGKTGTTAYAQARRDLRQAQVDTINAEQSATASVQDYMKQLKQSNVSQKDAISSLKGFAQQAGLSKGATKELIDELQQYINKTKQIPGHVHTDITLDTSKATSEFRSWVSAMSGTPVSVVARVYRTDAGVVPPQHRASGGLVHPYGVYEVGERGRELLELGASGGKVTPLTSSSGKVLPGPGGGSDSLARAVAKLSSEVASLRAMRPVNAPTHIHGSDPERTAEALVKLMERKRLLTPGRA